MRIIYIDIDSMRPDHMGCYGYKRNTTPNLDRIAAEGVRFNRFYCASSPCVPSRATFASGKPAISHGAITHWGPGSNFRWPVEEERVPGDLDYSKDSPLLPRYLREFGWKTVSFSSFADRHMAGWFMTGWNEMHTHSLKRGLEDADEVNAAVIPWLKKNGKDDRFFLHIQYWDPHRNYTMPEEWMESFRDEPLPEWPDEQAIAGHQSVYGPFAATELFPYRKDSPLSTMPAKVTNTDEWRHYLAGYDGAIAYMDRHIGELLVTLEELGVLDDTAFIISADHGEALGELGIYGDHVNASEPVHRIPMIVRWPGVTPNGKDFDGFAYNMDFHPTLCELLGIPTPRGWEGTSFAEAVRGGEWTGRDHLVWEHALYACQRAVRTDDYLYIKTYHPGLYPNDPEMLFDMRRDPRMTENLALARPDIVANMAAKLDDWYREHRERGNLADPMREVIESGPYRYKKLEPWTEWLLRNGREDALKDMYRRLESVRDITIDR